MQMRMLLFLLFALPISLPGQATPGQVIIIANPSVTASSVSKDDVRDIFTGSATTLKGAQITPVLMHAGTAHEQMLSLYVGRSDTAFHAAWRSLLFSGQGMVPKTFDSESALVDYVSHTSGAVGYISRTTPHEGVKLLIVR